MSDGFGSVVSQFGLGANGAPAYQRCYDPAPATGACVSTGNESLGSAESIVATDDSVYVGAASGDAINTFSRQAIPDPPGCPTAPPLDDPDCDGVTGTADACPDTAGATPSGCPDDDGDGVPNTTDLCPAIAAPGTSNGCPFGDPNVRFPNLFTQGSRLGDVQIDPASPEARCKGKAATVLGSHGQDLLLGRPEADVIVAGRGNDVVRGVDGNDVVCLGGGNDRANGGSGNDRLLGGSGKDRLNGARGNDRLIGGRGKDRCNGGGGRRDRAKCETSRGVP